MKKFYLILLAVIIVCRISSGQNAQKAVVKFVPAGNGYELNLTLSWKFIKCYNDIFIPIECLDKETTSNAYFYNGKRYIANELGANYFTNLKFHPFITTADVFLGVSKIGSIRMQFAIFDEPGDNLGCWSSITNGSTDFKGLLGIKDDDQYLDKLNQLSLSNIKIEKLYVDATNYDLEKQIKKLEGAKNNNPSDSGNSANSQNKTTSVQNNTSGSQPKTNTATYDQSKSYWNTTNKDAQNSVTSSNQSKEAEAERIKKQQDEQMKRANELAEQKKIAQQEQKRKEEEQKRRNLEAAQQVYNNYQAQKKQIELKQQAGYQAAAELANLAGNIWAAQEAERQRQNEIRWKNEEEQRQRDLEERRIADELIERERVEAQRIASLNAVYDAVPQLTKPGANDSEIMEVYYFYIIRMNKDELKISTPFPVRKLSDNSWPYKSDIDNKIKSAGSYVNPKLIGYFNSNISAYEKRGELIQKFQNSGFKLSNLDFTYKDYGAPINKEVLVKKKSSGTDDFWNK